MRSTPCRVTRLLASLALAALAGCGGDASEKVAKELEAGLSSTAAAQLVLESWLDNRLPISYASRSVDEERKRLEQHVKTIERMRPGDSRRASAVEALRRAATAAESGDVLRRRDTAAVHAHAGQLGAAATELRTLLARARSAR